MLSQKVVVLFIIVRILPTYSLGGKGPSAHLGQDCKFRKLLKAKTTTKRKTFIEPLLRRPIPLSTSGYERAAKQIKSFCNKVARLIRRNWGHWTVVFCLKLKKLCLLGSPLFALKNQNTRSSRDRSLALRFFRILVIACLMVDKLLFLKSTGFED